MINLPHQETPHQESGGVVNGTYIYKFTSWKYTVSFWVVASFSFLK
jgi:hypothetical protein